MQCANQCGEEIRRAEPGESPDSDFEWVHVSGNPYCDLVPVATPLEQDADGEHRVPVPVVVVPADDGAPVLGAV